MPIYRLKSIYGILCHSMPKYSFKSVYLGIKNCFLLSVTKNGKDGRGG